MSVGVDYFSIFRQAEHLTEFFYMSRQSGIFATITASAQTLYLASIDKSELPNITHPLLHALFFSKNEERFISYLETPSEISLVMEESSIALFPEDSIRIAERRWRAIQFSIGASPLENEGLISMITAPLGRAGISIFMLSTFNTDYVLVEESKFNEAKECLKSNFAIIWSDEQESSSSTASLQPTPSGDTPTPNVSSDTINQLQAFPELSLHLASIKTENLDFLLKDLIQLMFFSPMDVKRFLSFTQADGEISLIIDQESLSMLPKEKFEVIIEDAWVPLKRVRKFGFIETGVVSSLASPLRQMNLLYLSSYQTGYVLVMKKDLDVARKKLEEKGFVILPSVQKIK